jgi:DNA-nicking Smr family endonuclease
MTRKPEVPTKAEPSFRNDTLKEKLAAWKKVAAPGIPAQPVAQTAPPKLGATVSAAKRAPPKPAAKAAKSAAATEADAQLFRWAMEEVAPLVERPNQRRSATPSADENAVIDDDAEALAQLAELVATGDGLELAVGDAFLAGSVRGIDGSLLSRLRRGEFRAQARVELHGFPAEGAKVGLERFLVESRRQGLRCVLVVPGLEGPESDPVAVLKQRMGPWLTQGRLSRIVLAFATARPIDGGVGALYVLLRR